MVVNIVIWKRLRKTSRKPAENGWWWWWWLGIESRKSAENNAMMVVVVVVVVINGGGGFCDDAHKRYPVDRKSENICPLNVVCASKESEKSSYYTRKPQ